MGDENLKICIQKIINKNENVKHVKNDALKAAFLVSNRWPRDTVLSIYFMGDSTKIPRTSLFDIENKARKYGIKIDPLQNKSLDKMSIPDAIKKIIFYRFQPIVGVRFVFTTNVDESNIRISFVRGGGCWSVIGNGALSVSKSTATMNLGWFDVETVMHEFGHALGMIHEHQNSRGNNIKWNTDAVYAWAAKPPNNWDKQKAYDNIIKPYDTGSDSDMTNGSNFDPQSIMLYFYPPELTIDKKGTHENLRLSKYDVFWLNRNYPKKGTIQTNNKIISNFYDSIYGEKIFIGDNDLPENPEDISYTETSTDIYTNLTIMIVIVFILIIIMAFVIKK
jgi:hypothetical protein